ncbi:MAG: NAD(P)-binding domain-containing protein [Myxococcota bacterium]
MSSCFQRRAHSNSSPGYTKSSTTLAGLSNRKSHSLSSLRSALERSDKLKARPIAEAISPADVVFLATPFLAVEQIIQSISAQLAGKILVDCANPVGPQFTHGLQNRESGSRFIQSLVPQTSVVKAFSVYGFENFDDPNFPGYNVRPAMFFCGDDQKAKTSVAELIMDCGYEPLDVGGLEQALHLEHMTLMWVRMIRAGRKSPHLVWAALRRPRPEGA